MNNHWHDLIQQYISGTISDDDAAALEQQLISDSNLRDGYLDALNLDSALAATAESAELALSLPVLPSQRALTPALPSHWLSWRPLTAAAAGLVIGLFSASVVWAVAKPARSAQVRPVLSEGFEDAGMSFERGFPRSAGVWGGDKVQVVRSDSAEEGQQVLRFGPAVKRKFGYANSVVDILALADDVVGGRHELRLRASVRTVGGTGAVVLRRRNEPKGTGVRRPEAGRSAGWLGGPGSDLAVAGRCPASRRVDRCGAGG